MNHRAGIGGSIFKVLALDFFAVSAACGAPEDPLGNETTRSSTSAVTLQTNYARFATATQSSTAYGGDPGRAIDGNTDGSFPDNSVTHTDYTASPHWDLDLGPAPPEAGPSRWIDSIEIYNRTDCCGERLNNFYVFVSDFPFADTDTPMDIRTHLEVLSIPHPSTIGASISVPVQRRGRYVRVQLVDSGWLSLAEVRVLSPATQVPGPPALAAQTTWTPTSLYTDETSIAAVDVDNAVYAFQRGPGGLLNIARDADGRNSVVVDGSPQITTDGVAAAFDRPSHTLFVAVRTDSRGIRLAEATSTNGVLGPWTWTQFTPRLGAVQTLDNATGRPAIAVGCDRVFVGGNVHGSTVTAVRPISSPIWTLESGISGGIEPALAANAQGDVLIGAVRSQDNFVAIASFTCLTHVFSQSALLRSRDPWTERPLTVAQISLSAIGNRFAIAATGDTAGGVRFVLQSGGTLLAPTWPSVWEAGEALQHLGILNSPVLYTFRGLMFLAAKDMTTGLGLFTIREPNGNVFTDGYQTAWTAPRTIGGNGTIGTAPVFIGTGRRNLYGTTSPVSGGSSLEVGVMDELYVLARGNGDRQIYGLNFGRFATIDLLRDVYQVNLQSDAPLVAVPNLFDQMQAFLQIPASYWTAVTHATACTNPSRPLTVSLSNNVDGLTFEGCSDSRPLVYLDAGTGTGSTLWQEWGHAVAAEVQNFKTPEYYATFQVLPRRCTPGGSECSLCETVDTSSYAYPTTGPGPYCYTKWPGLSRLTGFVWDYDLSPPDAMAYDEHEFLDVVTFYRWAGDTLRTWVADDLAVGSNVLQLKYNWIRDHYYHGAEFNGAAASINASISDETMGAYATPLN